MCVWLILEGVYHDVNIRHDDSHTRTHTDDSRPPSSLCVPFPPNRIKDLLGDQSRSGLTAIGQTLALNLAIGMAVPNIDNYGHAGGLLAGGAVAWMIGPRLRCDVA